MTGVQTCALPILKIGLFKIISKVTEVIYRLNLLLKIKIYLVYYITILEPVYKNHEPLMSEYKDRSYIVIYHCCVVVVSLISHFYGD